jgi:hypothetical protein
MISKGGTLPDMGDVRLKKHELAKVSGNHSRVILDWTQRGYVVPAEKAEGQGKISYYSAENVVQAKVLKKLSQSAISLSAFSEIFKKLPKSLDPFKPIHKDAVYALCVRDNVESVSILYYDKRREKHPLPGDLRGDFSTLVIVNLKEIMEEVRIALS